MAAGFELGEVPKPAGIRHQATPEWRHSVKGETSLCTHSKDILSVRIWLLDLRGEMDSFSSTLVKGSEC